MRSQMWETEVIFKAEGRKNLEGVRTLLCSGREEVREGIEIDSIEAECHILLYYSYFLSEERVQ